MPTPRSALGAALALASAAAAAAGPAPSTAWRERPLPLEDTLLASIPALVRQVQDYNTRFFGEARARTFHPLPLAGFRARLTVDEDLPPEARHGIFVPGARYRGFARFSRGLGIFRSDRIPDIWGMALKLLDVPGEPLLADPVHGTVQDFTALNAESFPAPDASAVPRILHAAADYARFLWRGPRALRVRDLPRAAAIFGRLLLRRVRSLATETYFSGAPIRVGPYAAKFRFVPLDPPRGPRRGGKAFLAADLGDRADAEALAFALELQFFTDEARTPIEHAMKPWKAPWVRVARLDLTGPRPRAGPDSRPEVRRALLTARVDGLYFHPWQGVEAHRPLGSVMRARRVAYSASQMYRGRPTADPVVVKLEAAAPRGE